MSAKCHPPIRRRMSEEKARRTMILKLPTPSIQAAHGRRRCLYTHRIPVFKVQAGHLTREEEHCSQAAQGSRLCYVAVTMGCHPPASRRGLRQGGGAPEEEDLLAKDFYMSSGTDEGAVTVCKV